MKSYSKMFMSIAEITAKESNCIKYQVGAVAVKDNRIILQGYNGTISGFTNCSSKFKNVDIFLKENREIHNKWSATFEIHAEMNIICYASKKGISLQDAQIYCTHAPCNNCLKHLIQTGVSEVIYKEEYLDNVQFEERNELLNFIKLTKI